MKLTGLVGLLTAFISSLCCTVPLLTLVVGATGTAGRWAWLEPLRPYSIALTIGALGWAWYNQLKPVSNKECACDMERVSFWQTKPFLGVITALALLLLTFPSYSSWFYQSKNQPLQTARSSAGQVAYVTIKGMTCAGCEQHVKSELAKLSGVTKANVSYARGNAAVMFDPKQTSIDRIRKAVSVTGYQVVDIKITRTL